MRAVVGVFIITAVAAGLGYLLYPWVMGIVERSSVTANRMLVFANPVITDAYIAVEARNVGSLDINITRIMVNDAEYPLSNPIHVAPYSTQPIYVYGSFKSGAVYQLKIQYSTGYEYTTTLICP